MQTNRVTREQVLEASRGMLQKQFYVVFSTPTDGLEFTHAHRHRRSKVAAGLCGSGLARECSLSVDRFAN